MNSAFFKKYRVVVAISLILLLVIILLVLPLKIDYSVKTVARIIPARQWILQKSSDGSLISSINDYRSGFTESYSAAQIERGDAVRFKMNSSILSKKRIAAGDTICYISSNEIERRLAELRGYLDMARASLQFYLTGDKEAVIAEARRAAELNREQANLQRKLLVRQTELFGRELVSKEALEIAQTTTRISELEAELAVARLQSAETGAKPEQIELVRSEINRYEKEIKVLEDRLGQFIICSPINGKIYKSFSSDTLLMAGSESLLVIVPVSWSEREFILNGGRVQLNLSNAPQGSILRIDDNVTVLNGEQVFTVIAELEEDETEPPAYLYSTCEIEGSRLTVTQYLGRLIKRMFSR